MHERAISPLEHQPSPFPSLTKRPAFTHASSLQIETRAQRTQLLGLSPELPGHKYAQKEVLELLGYRGNRTAEAIFRNAGVSERYLVMGPEGFDLTTDVRYQDELFIHGTLMLAEGAVRGALKAAGVAPEQLGALVISSSSGFQMPSLSARLVARMKLPTDMAKFDVAGAGCVGALPGMSLVDGYLATHPDKLAMMVCLDVGSQVLRKADPEDKEAMVANALFSDAAVGMVFGRGLPLARMPELVDLHYVQAYDTLDSAFVSKDGHGAWQAHLHKGMPERAAGIFLPGIETFLDKHQLAREDVRFWVFHPGGRAILDRLQSDLGLSDEQMAPSRQTLRQYGNASGPTCLLALNQVVGSDEPQPGDWGLLGAIGPGLTVGLALLRWPSA
ncbi:MAG TPA: 3-oxoacyl-[acyl-carrier-protein] synthase III C-terminal domain-containing protein [Stenomitos sp.]